jgi:hypothetical protein
MPAATKSLLFICIAQAGFSSEFRFQDVCLAVDMEKHEFYSPGFPLRYGSPFLLVPAPFATPDLTDAEDRQGIGVFYLPINERKLARRLDDRDRSNPGDCIEAPYAFDLVQVSDDPLHKPKGTDPVTCAASDTKVDLMPEEKTVPLVIRCPGDMRTGACWASYYLDQNWEARFLVSPGDLSEWRMIVSLVNIFFENELERCIP